VIRRIAILAGVLAVCIAAVVLTGASEGEGGKAFKVELDNAFGLTEGGDLRMGGVRAGRTTTFGLTDTEPTKAVVGFEITQPGFESLRTDAFCQVRQQSLIGEYYIDCQPGNAEEELAEGATIPVDQTASIIPADLVNNVLRRPYRERLRLIIAELGTGLAGRPQDLAEALRRAHPGLRETSKTLEILGRQRQIIQDFVQDSDAVVAELAANRANVTRFVREAGEAAEISASRSDELAAGFERLPGFLERLQPYMASLGRLADEQIPLLADLRRGSSDLHRFFRRLGPFANATRPALRSLGDASVEGKDALDESRDEVRELRDLSRRAPKLATPLRQFLVSLDDRGRAVERDVRAAETAPPRPDPTAKGAGRGFTGFEAFMNYFGFWQPLAVNGFDEISHFLRILIVESEACGPFSVAPEKELIEQCNTYLGPNQPGIENATGEINGRHFPGSQPDPYSPKGSASTASDNGGKDKAQASTDRGGRDERNTADPYAGRGKQEPQPGLSEPKYVLPGVDELLDGVGRGVDRALPDVGRPRTPRSDEPGSGRAPDRLLDFLLGP
jgi:ABC-type transporter Mla subunit MlaD